MNPINNHILIVEDNPCHAELIIEAIRDANIVNKIIHVDNGPQALEIAKGNMANEDIEANERPSVILLDLKLPGMDGKEILKSLKSDEKTEMIPVIILTSSEQDRDIQECYRLGANSYILKPISSGDFFKKVKAIPIYWFLYNVKPKVS